MFHSYPKITNRLDFQAKISGTWVASEKVHGANLAIVCTADAIYPCRRKASLKDHELGEFFGLITIWSRLFLAAQAALELLGSDCILYGELCGGTYPNYQTSPQVTPVQGGIYYSPHLEFFLFDVYVPKDELWLSDTRVRELAYSIKMHTTPLLARGKYQQMMRLPVDFQTHVPNLLGYPKLTNNRAEGLVIKPDRDMRTQDRTVLKIKRKGFQDTIAKTGDRRALLQSYDSQILGEAIRMLTPARVSSARSKVGPQGNMVQEILADIVEDLTFAGHHLDAAKIEYLIEYLKDPVHDLVIKNT